MGHMYVVTVKVCGIVSLWISLVSRCTLDMASGLVGVTLSADQVADGFSHTTFASMYHCLWIPYLNRSS